MRSCQQILESPFSITLIFTGARRIPATRGINQGARKRRFSPTWGLLAPCAGLSRANVAHARQSRPDSGLGFQAKVRETF